MAYAKQTWVDGEAGGTPLDASRLNYIENGLQAAAAVADAAQPVDSDLTVIAGLDSGVAGVLSTDGAGWIRKTYAQLKTALGLVKADVGLGGVDNTSDVNKPVSTAQQAALDLKAPLASPALTGTPTVPTAAPGTSTTQVASTAFSAAAIAAQHTTDNGTYAPLASPTFSGAATIADETSGAVTPILNLKAFGRDWQIGIDTSNDGGGRSLFMSKFVNRTVDDLATTNTSTTVTSASEARFGPADNGTLITGAGIPGGTTLVWVRGTDTLTTARLSAAATATATGVTATIGSNAAAVQDLFFFRDNGGNGAALGIGITPPTGTHRLEVGGSDSDTVQGGIRIRVGPSSTGTALSVYDSGGTEQYSIDSAFYANQVRIRGVTGGRLTTLATNDLANSWGWDIDGTQGKGVLALRYLTTAHDALYAGTDGSIRIVTKLIVDTMTANSTLNVTAPSTAGPTIQLKRVSGQSGAILLIRDESNVVLASVNIAGQLFMTKQAAPTLASTGGFLYVDASGNLRYRGPTTDTQLAVA